MRLSIAGARAAALAWLKTRNLPPARFVAQKGYDAERQGRRHVALLPVEKLEKTMPLIEFLVHDDGSVTVVSDTSIQVLNDLLSQGINPYKTPGLLDHEGAFKFFIASLKMHSEVPEWFVALDVCEPIVLHEPHDAFANVRRSEERIIPVPVKIFPTRTHKHNHMRPVDSRIASRMIAMVVNRHVPALAVSTEFFTRLTHMRESYLTAKD